MSTQSVFCQQVCQNKIKGFCQQVCQNKVTGFCQPVCQHKVIWVSRQPGKPWHKQCSVFGICQLSTSTGNARWLLWLDRQHKLGACCRLICSYRSVNIAKIRSLCWPLAQHRKPGGKRPCVCVCARARARLSVCSFITIQETNQFVVGGVGFVKSFSMAGIMVGLRHSTRIMMNTICRCIFFTVFGVVTTYTKFGICQFSIVFCFGAQCSGATL